SRRRFANCSRAKLNFSATAQSPSTCVTAVFLNPTDTKPLYRSSSRIPWKYPMCCLAFQRVYRRFPIPGHPVYAAVEFPLRCAGSLPGGTMEDDRLLVYVSYFDRKVLRIAE